MLVILGAIQGGAQAGLRLPVKKAVTHPPRQGWGAAPIIPAAKPMPAKKK